MLWLIWTDSYSISGRYDWKTVSIATLCNVLAVGMNWAVAALDCNRYAAVNTSQLIWSVLVTDIFIVCGRLFSFFSSAQVAAATSSTNDSRSLDGQKHGESTTNAAFPSLDISCYPRENNDKEVVTVHQTRKRQWLTTIRIPRTEKNIKESLEFTSTCQDFETNLWKIVSELPMKSSWLETVVTFLKMVGEVLGKRWSTMAVIIMNERFNLKDVTLKPTAWNKSQTIVPDVKERKEKTEIAVLSSSSTNNTTTSSSSSSFFLFLSAASLRLSNDTPTCQLCETNRTTEDEARRRSQKKRKKKYNKIKKKWTEWHCFATPQLSPVLDETDMLEQSHWKSHVPVPLIWIVIIFLGFRSTVTVITV